VTSPASKLAGAISGGVKDAEDFDGVGGDAMGDYVRRAGEDQLAREFGGGAFGCVKYVRE
jgi:hypothetical protein